jgi:hypothetical protein
MTYEFPSVANIFTLFARELSSLATKAPQDIQFDLIA